MRIASALGLSSARKIRYAIVGLGDLSQEVMLPGVAHTGSSEVAALLTDDPVKPREVGARYGVDETCGYDGFDALDLRVIEGIMKALETQQPQALPAFTRSRRIDTDARKRRLSMIDPPEPMHAAGPSRS